MLRRAICQLPKTAVVKQVRSMAAPAAEPAFTAAPGSLPSGSGAARVEAAKTTSTSRATGRMCNNYFQVRQATSKPEPSEAKKSLRQGVMQNLFF